MARTRTIGWREWVTLPDLGVDALKAKVDTGARTSALHAVRMREHDDGEGPQISFVLHPHQRSTRDSIRLTLPVIGHKSVRSSDGRSEIRPVIKTRVKVGSFTFTTPVTLTNRTDMGFRMLLGRTALRRRFVVDPSSSFLTREKP